MYSDFQLTASLWRRKLIPRWGMVKGLKGTRQNLNCNRVIKLTMGLRLHFLKPLMLKTPTESNGGWTPLFLKIRQLPTQLYFEEVQRFNPPELSEKRQKLAHNVCSCSSLWRTWTRKHMVAWSVFQVWWAEKTLICWHVYSEDPANSQMDSFMWRHFLGQTWIRSLSVPAAFLLLYLLACRSKHINGTWENSQLETWHHTVCYWVTLVFSFLYQQRGQFMKSQTSQKWKKDLFGS